MRMNNVKSWIPVIVLGGVVIAVAQSKPELTARELFYLPVSGTPAAKKAAPVASKATTPKKADPVVAANTPKPPKPNRVEPTSPPPSTTQPGWGEVRLETVAYSGNRPLGLRYSLFQYEKVGSRWNADEVSPDKNFRTGDRVQVQVEANEEGYLYIVQRGTSGDWNVLFPSQDINAGKNRVPAMEAVRIPSGRAFFTFSGDPGTEKLYIVLARKQVADIEQLILDLNQSKNTPAPPAAAQEPAPKKTAAPAKAKDPKRGPTLLAQAISPIDDPLTGRQRSQMLARDLVFEKVDEDSGTQKDKSVYVVDKSGRADANFIVEVPLKHQ